LLPADKNKKIPGRHARLICLGPDILSWWELSYFFVFIAGEKKQENPWLSLRSGPAISSWWERCYYFGFIAGG
jgi:hypothetical protein